MQALILHPEISLNCNLSNFIPVTDIQLRRLIKSFPSKACDLDPLPTWLLKDCLDELLPVLTHIINASLSSGAFPRSFRESLILPVLKKPNLDPNVLGNYRPIANLPFVSKVMERIAADQIMSYVDSHHLLPRNQSAYRNFHSTETALLKVLNDLLLAVDKGDEAVLLLLDYSAAFDTLDHTMLHQRLAKDYSITGTVLQWIISYLQHRTQRVKINGTLSAPSSLSCGVPQGSVVGPLLFLLYTGPLARIITSHQDINYAMYADDTQIYLTMSRSPHGKRAAVNSLKACLEDIKVWSTNNRLRLNNSKSELIHFSSQFRSAEPLPALIIEDDSLQTSEYVRDLGVTLDKHLTLQQHIKTSANQHLGVYLELVS